MPMWKTGDHAEVPSDAGLVFGTNEPGKVTWLDESASGAPEVVDVPVISQNGATISCTQGNWQGTPTSYAYQWKIDGADVGTDSATYDVQAGDIGKTATCVVTATNAEGSTAAPPSNALVVV
jgi:hypothetical protein